MRKGLKESAVNSAADISNGHRKETATAAVPPALAAVSTEVEGIVNRLVVGDLVIHRKVAQSRESAHANRRGRRGEGGGIT